MCFKKCVKNCQLIIIAIRLHNFYIFPNNIKKVDNSEREKCCNINFLCPNIYLIIDLAPLHSNYFIFTIITSKICSLNFTTIYSVVLIENSKAVAGVLY